jgi:Fis family transcriptional regulator, factor for inversion stimulation protein
MKAEAQLVSMDLEAPSRCEGNGLLSQHVRLAVEDYLRKLEGYSANDLYDMVLSEVERPMLEAVLEHCGHNQSRAAQVLGLSRSTLRKKMTHHGLG